MANLSRWSDDVKELYQKAAETRNLAIEYSKLAKRIRQENGSQRRYCQCLTRYADLMRAADRMIDRLPLVM